jgi:GTP cyclohydrolase I
MSNLERRTHIPDTQSERDERHFMIQRVGVEKPSYSCRSCASAMRSPP